MESVTPQPRDGEQPTVVLRNMGGNAANITGYRLFASNSPTPPAAGTNASANGPTLFIADERRCRENGTLAPGQALFLRPRSELSPCGFPFNLGQRYVHVHALPSLHPCVSPSRSCRSDSRVFVLRCD